MMFVIIPTFFLCMLFLQNSVWAGDKVILKVGVATKKGTTQERTASDFGRLCEEKSGGDLSVKIYHSGQLGGERDLVEGVIMGTIDGSVNSTILGNWARVIQVLDLPLIYRDADHLERVLKNEEIMTPIKKALLRAGIHPLGFSYAGFRWVYTAKKINSAGDLKGVKIRAPEIDIYVQTIKAMGALPTVVPWPETYTALQTGLVKGVELPPMYAWSSKAHETCKYYIKTNHIANIQCLHISEKTFQKLSKEHQKIVEEAGEEGMAIELKKVREDTAKYEAKFKDAGLKECKIDIDVFRKNLKPVVLANAEKYGGLDILKKIEKLAR